MTNAWTRVTRLKRCPICKKPDWCLISPDRSAVICPRTEQGSSRFIEGSGYLHVLKITDEWMNDVPRRRVMEPLPEHNEVLAIRARQWVRGCEDEHVQALADSWGVPTSVLRDMNIGWMPQKSAWTFPMMRAGKRLLGVRLRLEGGKKFSIKGSKNALFIPNSLTDSGVVLICEGESDTAAALGAGFQAVGRPSCNSGQRLLVDLLRDRTCVVCIDSDGPGRAGGYQLLRYLDDHVPRVDILEPPPRYKDVRDWINGEEGKEEIRTAVERIHGQPRRAVSNSGDPDQAGAAHRRSARGADSICSG